MTGVTQTKSFLLTNLKEALFFEDGRISVDAMFSLPKKGFVKKHRFHQLLPFHPCIGDSEIVS